MSNERNMKHELSRLGHSLSLDSITISATTESTVDPRGNYLIYYVLGLVPPPPPPHCQTLTVTCCLSASVLY